MKCAPTPFLLHFTTRQNWIKIQKEGLVPQKNNAPEDHLPDRVIWLGREPVEAYVNKDQHPIVIALPINHEKFGLQETIHNAEYVADKYILPKEFLGVFDFTQYNDEHKQQTEFANWLEKMTRHTK